MGLSRKRQRELKQLRETASHVWDQQKDVLEQASHIVREASRQAARLGREEVAPRMRDAVDNHIRPGVATGIATTKSVASTTRDKFVDDVLPAVASTLGSAIAVLETAKDPRVRAAAGKIGKNVSRFGTKAGITAVKASSGPGRYILAGVGIVAIAGVAYAAWQTLRADDELWVADETDEFDDLDEG
jgi:hypothetical protein